MCFSSEPYAIPTQSHNDHVDNVLGDIFLTMEVHSTKINLEPFYKLIQVNG